MATNSDDVSGNGASKRLCVAAGSTGHGDDDYDGGDSDEETVDYASGEEYYFDDCNGDEETAVGDGPRCLSLRCPDPACPAAVVQDLVDAAADAADKDRYARFALLSYVEEGGGGVKWCPAASCTRARRGARRRAGHVLRLPARLLLELRRGGAPAGVVRHGARVAGQEQVGLGDDELGAGQHQALPQVPASSREQELQ
jgi:hypothetical protein